jgi:hypothetical protein
LLDLFLRKQRIAYYLKALDAESCILRRCHAHRRQGEHKHHRCKHESHRLGKEIY